MTTRPTGDVTSALSRLPLFASLAPADAAAAAALFVPRSCLPGEVLFFEGEPPERLYVVTAGHAKLVKQAEDGREVILDLAMPGDLLGGVAAFGRRPHPYTAQAMVPMRVLGAAGADFLALMRRHPGISSQVLLDLTGHLVAAHEAMKSLATERVDRRIARRLTDLAARAGHPVPGGVRIDVPLTRQDVADMAGTTVETAIRVLSRWRREGLADTAGGRIVVTDLDALRAMADEPT